MRAEVGLPENKDLHDFAIFPAITGGRQTDIKCVNPADEAIAPKLSWEYH